MRRLFRFLGIIASAIILAVIFFATIVYLGRNELIASFLKEANQHIKTPISVKAINLNLIKDFPKIGLEIDNITITESTPQAAGKLATADKLFISFDAIGFFNQKYIIEKVSIKNAHVHMKLFKDGTTNYDIIKKQPKNLNEGKEKSVSLAIENLILNNLTYVFEQPQNNSVYHVTFKKAKASIDKIPGKWLLALDGDGHIKKIKNDGNNFLKNLPVSLDAKIEYSQTENLLTFGSGRLLLNNQKFTTKGFVNISKKELDIALSSPNAELMHLIKLIPQRHNPNIEKYTQEGQVYFEGKIAGSYNQNQKPDIDLKFGCQNVSISDKDNPNLLRNINLTGFFMINKKHPDGLLQLDNFKGKFDLKPFKGKLLLKNFKNPYVALQFEGELNLGLISGFYNKTQPVATGKAIVDIVLTGQPQNNRKKLETEGEIELLNVCYLHNKPQINLKDANGYLVFNNNNVAFSALKCQINQTKLQADGIVLNIIPFALGRKNTPLGMRLVLETPKINLNQWLALTDSLQADNKNIKDINKTQKPETKTNFNLQLNSRADTVIYKNLKFNNVKINVSVQNDTTYVNNTVLGFCDGTLALRGYATNQDTLQNIHLNYRLSNVRLDSIFSAFNNFDQTNLTHNQIAGRLSGNGNLQFSMQSDSSKVVIPATKATFLIDVKNGKLNNYEPLQALSKFIKEETLKNVDFSQFEVLGHIDNSTLFFDKFILSTNAANLYGHGTHTFKQEINYEISIPLKSIGKNVNNDFKGTVVPIKITGTVSSPNIAYNRKAAKDSVLAGLQREKEEFKQLFKKQKNTQKEIPVTDTTNEQFFDFNNEAP